MHRRARVRPGGDPVPAGNYGTGLCVLAGPAEGGYNKINSRVPPQRPGAVRGGRFSRGPGGTMDRIELIRRLNGVLLDEMPAYRGQAAGFPDDLPGQRRLLRSLMNLRPPMPLEREFLAMQDALLCAERAERGVVDAGLLPVTAGDPRLALWQGDITRLRADAIVDAGNDALLGCFCPCHGCIDNAIHSAAGLQLRDECSRIMRPCQADGGVQSSGEIRPAHGGAGRPGPRDGTGPPGAVLLLPRLPRAGGGARPANGGVLLRLHRRIPFPERGGR